MKYLIFTCFLCVSSTLQSQHSFYPNLFIIGSDSLEIYNGAGGNFFVYDLIKGGFSGGRLRDSDWHPDSIGIYSFAMGDRTNASGESAISLGRITKATGHKGATALGDRTTASGDEGATALGSKTIASGNFGATALGYHTEAAGDNCIAVGLYNDPIVITGQVVTPTSPLFIVGNGEGEVLSNAMVVRKDGNIGLSTDTPSALLHIQSEDNINNPHLKITDEGADAFIRIEMNRESVADKSWFHSATTNASDALSYYSFIYDDGASLVPLIRMDGLGHTGLGKFPGANRLEVQGEASKTTAGDWLANSDRRIKTDITEIENSFALLEQLHPVKFKYSEEWKARNPSIKDQYYYNFIAQEYQEVFPESVQGSGEYLENNDQEILQVDTYNAQIATIAAVKELIKENQSFKEAIHILQGQNNLLQSQINELITVVTETSQSDE